MNKVNVKQIISSLRQAISESIFLTAFFFLVIALLVRESFHSLASIRYLGKIFIPLDRAVQRIYKLIEKVVNQSDAGHISSSDLILLAYRHLKVKKARSLITIGGMAIGFGSVILLLSLGYGVQRLVISQVASLNEMRQTEVSTGQASSLSLNDDALKEFEQIEAVDDVLPLISLVSKVSFNGSVSDVVAYGVSDTYLKESALQPVQGKFFTTDNSVSYDVSEVEVGQVAGVSIAPQIGAKMGQMIQNVSYSIHPLVWKAVYKNPSRQSELIGYTKRSVGDQEAVEVWGAEYPGNIYEFNGIDDYGNVYGRWIEDQFLIWEKIPCDVSELECSDGAYQIVKKESGHQLISEGFIDGVDTEISRYEVITSEAELYQEGKVISQVEFTIPANTYVQTYQKPSSEDENLALFTTAQKEEAISGSLVFGKGYSGEWGAVVRNGNGAPLGAWVRVELPLWRKVDCEQKECDTLFLSEIEKDSGIQKSEIVYLKAEKLVFNDIPEPLRFGSVLGEATGSAELATETELETLLLSAGFDKNSPEWIQIASQAGVIQEVKKETLSFSHPPQQQAVINRAMVQLLGLPETEAVGQTFEVSFLADGDVLGKEDEYQAESDPLEYTIVGVVAEDKTPAFYLPFGDLRSLGIQVFSQVTIISQDQELLTAVRQAIESLGYKTTSVVDTVNRINTLFGTLRVVLLALGFIALGVASLGMFNTLTVSLLEKTREVGLMKAMGMKSHEVKRLFLAESMIMGLSGGVVGLLFGFFAGRVINVLLSTISVSKGVGVISVVYIPLYLTGTIFVLSFLIGFFTGLFPARRATKISALNALRYE